MARGFLDGQNIHEDCNDTIHVIIPKINENLMLFVTLNCELYATENERNSEDLVLPNTFQPFSFPFISAQREIMPCNVLHY